MTKPFKFELWMLGLVIIPVGIVLSVISILKTNSVELGGACRTREECKAPAEACLPVGTQFVCAVSCGTRCPAGFKCVELNVSLKNATGFTEFVGKYCLTPALAATVPQ